MNLKILNTHLIFIFVVFILTACSTTNKISVSNVNDIKTLPAGDMIYGLPQTTIDVTVYAEETIIVPGPYHEFAEKYLSIENAPSDEKRTWTISKIDVATHTEVDPDFVYTIGQLTGFSQSAEIERLLNDSLILFPSDFAHNAVFYNSLPYKDDDIHFFDYSVKRNFEVDDSEVIISKVLPGVSDDRRLTSAQASEKTLERKAEEAANFIIKLRKRRFKLVAGQYDYMPDGPAMIKALEQLDKTEADYLSLFTGKKITRSHVQTFHYTPESAVSDERTVLFMFSDTEGFNDSRESIGKPVLLELTNSHKTAGLNASGLSTGSKNSFLIYRIPDLAYGRLIYGEEVVIDGYLSVFQYGKTATFKL